MLESTSTLRFAATCKELKTKAKVNDVSLSVEVDTLRAEVERLKAELATGMTVMYIMFMYYAHICVSFLSVYIVVCVYMILLKPKQEEEERITME